MSTSAWMLVAACVVPWLLLEGYFLWRLKHRAIAPDPDEGEAPS